MSCCVWSGIDGARGVAMIEMRRGQLSFGGGLIKWSLAVGPQVLRQIHDRIVTIARDKGVIAGRHACGHDGGGDEHPLSDR
jgi:hypothetical protein